MLAKLFLSLMLIGGGTFMILKVREPSGHECYLTEDINTTSVYTCEIDGMDTLVNSSYSCGDYFCKVKLYEECDGDNYIPSQPTCNIYFLCIGAIVTTLGVCVFCLSLVSVNWCPERNRYLDI